MVLIKVNIKIIFLYFFIIYYYREYVRYYLLYESCIFNEYASYGVSGNVQ